MWDARRQLTLEINDCRVASSASLALVSSHHRACGAKKLFHFGKCKFNNHSTAHSPLFLPPLLLSLYCIYLVCILQSALTLHSTRQFFRFPSGAPASAAATAASTTAPPRSAGGRSVRLLNSKCIWSATVAAAALNEAQVAGLKLVAAAATVELLVGRGNVYANMQHDILRHATRRAFQIGQIPPSS